MAINGIIKVVNILILLHLRGIKIKRVTRKQKREKQEDINFFGESIKIQNHFFKDINSRLKGVKDKRHQSYVVYAPDIILYSILMKT